MTEPTLRNVPALKVASFEIEIHTVRALRRRGNLHRGWSTGFPLGLAFGLRRGSHELDCGLDATKRLPGWRAGRRRQFFDRHILHLHQRNATRMHLRRDLAIQRDVGIGLGVVDREHVIDPHLDAWPFGADAVCIPAKNIDDLLQSLRIDRLRNDLAPTKLVIDLSKPPVTAIDLIAAHVRPAAHPLAANLNAAVDQARRGIAAALDGHLQLEVLIPLLGADEVVRPDLLRP